MVRLPAALVTELAPGFYQVATDYPAVADAPEWLYLATGPESFMVDAACASTWDAVLGDAFGELGMAAADLDWVLITHGHPDHTGAVSALRGAGSRCRVVASLADAPWIECFERQWEEFWCAYPGVVDVEPAHSQMRDMSGGDLRVDHIVRDGDVLALGEHEVEVIETRSHTPGHTAYFDRTTGILLTGDLALGRVIPAASGTSNFGPLYRDVDEHLAALRRLRELPFTWVCAAHIAAQPRAEGLALIDDALAAVERNEEVVMAAVESSGSASLHGIAQALGEEWGMEPAVWVHSAYVADAHLRRAAALGRIEPRWAMRPG